MAYSGYFDTPEVSGFTWRTYLTEDAGTVAITAMQLRSRTYKETWYPGGEIRINGVPALTMNYSSPATHSVYIYSAGDTFADVSGPLPEPVKVSAAKAVIAVQVELFRKSGDPKPQLSGSLTLDLASILAEVHNGTGFVQKQAVAHNGASFRKYRPIVHDGAEWSK